jgi:hypothetical protein
MSVVDVWSIFPIDITIHILKNIISRQFFNTVNSLRNGITTYFYLFTRVAIRVETSSNLIKSVLP